MPSFLKEHFYFYASMLFSLFTRLKLRAFGICWAAWHCDWSNGLVCQRTNEMVESLKKYLAKTQVHKNIIEWLFSINLTIINLKRSLRILFMDPNYCPPSQEMFEDRSSPVNRIKANPIYLSIWSPNESLYPISNYHHGSNIKSPIYQHLTDNPNSLCCF